MSAFFTRCKREMVTLVFIYYVESLVFPPQCRSKNWGKRKEDYAPFDRNLESFESVVSGLRIASLEA
jgi:hypothetical protein